MLKLGLAIGLQLLGNIFSHTKGLTDSVGQILQIYHSYNRILSSLRLRAFII